MVAHRDGRHQFAVYVHNLSQTIVHKVDTIQIHDAAIMHRMVHVLRLQKDDVLILFDSAVHVCAKVLSIEKKSIIYAIQAIVSNAIITPHITVWLPLLKREAFEETVYSLVELGVQEIQLLHTAKEQRHWTGQKEMQRTHNIMIAAAEQSKNFAMTIVREPKTLPELLALKKDEIGIFFDAEGKALLECVADIKQNNAMRYILAVGPEGDLLDSEKFQLQKASFLFARLTPTVLRAQQAVAVGVGAVRSFL